MIFVTVGTQLPFNRLLRAVDAWAARNPGVPVHAQTGCSSAILGHVSCSPFLTKPEMDAAFARARVIVGHAGMGTILTAAELGKPVIVLPRAAALGEHRNDHQAATVARLRNLPVLHVAPDDAAIGPLIDRCLARDGVAAAVSRSAQPALLAAVSQFIRGGSPLGAA